MFKHKKHLPFKRVTEPILTQGPTRATIRVQLDAKTSITLHNMATLAVWLIRYPNAKVIESLQ